MTIAEWGAIGELIGALAVLVTVAYLAVQVRQAQHTMISTAQQSISDTSAQLFAAISTSDGLAETFAKAAAGQSLDRIEVQRLGAWWSAVLRHAENMHYQWEQGLLPTELHDASGKRIASGLLVYPFALEHWRNVAANHRPAFARWMDAKIEAAQGGLGASSQGGAGSSRG